MTSEKAAEIISTFCRMQMRSKKDIPIRASEMGLLILTAHSDTPLTPVKAAGYFHISKSRITAMLLPLIENGYIQKKPSSDDGRSYILVATGKGKRLVWETYDSYHKHVEILRRGMGDSAFEQFIRALDDANHLLCEATPEQEA